MVDRDPASGCFYEPVDLNDPYLLAQDGLPPSESNPQFHQQMVYAVAMRTIRSFEQALGRLALWRAHDPCADADGKVIGDEYVQRLRIYPHALREANAYYSPDKKALLFGYFPAPVGRGDPGAARITVFTCLSHDIIAHETTHALLDGMHRRFIEPSNPDVLAFHEAFADIVALFQHFSLPGSAAAPDRVHARRPREPEPARRAGAAVRPGDRQARRAAQRARRRSIRRPASWQPARAGSGATTRRHRAARPRRHPGRGGVRRVPAIYKARVADLLRIASDGTGVLPAGQPASRTW